MSTKYDHDCEYENDYECEKSETFTGNAIDLDLKKCDSEVRADIRVGKSKKNCVRVWGQIKDCEGKPVKEALIKLLRAYYYHGKVEYEGVAHTTTDCMGFYQFDVCDCDEHAKYRILVSKASTGGKERIIHDNGGICNPCDKDDDKCDKDC